MVTTAAMLLITVIVLVFNRLLHLSNNKENNLATKIAQKMTKVAKKTRKRPSKF